MASPWNRSQVTSGKRDGDSQPPSNELEEILKPMPSAQYGPVRRHRRSSDLFHIDNQKNQSIRTITDGPSANFGRPLSTVQQEKAQSTQVHENTASQFPSNLAYQGVTDQGGRGRAFRGYSSNESEFPPLATSQGRQPGAIQGFESPFPATFADILADRDEGRLGQARRVSDFSALQQGSKQTCQPFGENSSQPSSAAMGMEGMTHSCNFPDYQQVGRRGASVSVWSECQRSDFMKISGGGIEAAFGYRNDKPERDLIFSPRQEGSNQPATAHGTGNSAPHHFPMSHLSEGENIMSQRTHGGNETTTVSNIPKSQAGDAQPIPPSGQQVPNKMASRLPFHHESPQESVQTHQSPQGLATPRRAESQLSYTTAGTVWTPQSAQLTPPVRRGRALKYQQSVVAEQLGRTGLVDGIGFSPGTLQRGSTSFSQRSPPQYEPLQQNCDRAVSPEYNPERELLQKFAQPRSTDTLRSASSMADTVDTSGHGDDTTKGVLRECGEPSKISDDALRRLPLTTLMNLASYPNPNRAMAQEALRSARELAASAGSMVGGNASMGAGSETRDPVNAGAVQPNDDPRSSKSLVLANPRDPFQSNTQGNNFQAQQMRREHPVHHFGSITLATGPGAPEPLTAGPPGQRYYRPSSSQIGSTTRNIGPHGDSVFDIHSSGITHQPQIDHNSEHPSGSKTPTLPYADFEFLEGTHQNDYSQRYQRAVEKAVNTKPNNPDAGSKETEQLTIEHGAENMPPATVDRISMAESLTAGTPMETRLDALGYAKAADQKHRHIKVASGNEDGTNTSEQSEFPRAEMNQYLFKVSSGASMSTSSSHQGLVKDEAGTTESGDSDKTVVPVKSTLMQDGVRPSSTLRLPPGLPIPQVIGRGIATDPGAATAAAPWGTSTGHRTIGTERPKVSPSKRDPEDSAQRWKAAEKEFGAKNIQEEAAGITTRLFQNVAPKARETLEMQSEAFGGRLWGTVPGSVVIHPSHKSNEYSTGQRAMGSYSYDSVPMPAAARNVKDFGHDVEPPAYSPWLVAGNTWGLPPAPQPGVCGASNIWDLPDDASTVVPATVRASGGSVPVATLRASSKPASKIAPQYPPGALRMSKDQLVEHKKQLAVAIAAAPKPVLQQGVYPHAPARMNKEQLAEHNKKLDNMFAATRSLSLGASWKDIQKNLEKRERKKDRGIKFGAVSGGRPGPSSQTRNESSAKGKADAKADADMTGSKEAEVKETVRLEKPEHEGLGSAVLLAGSFSDHSHDN